MTKESDPSVTLPYKGSLGEEIYDLLVGRGQVLAGKTLKLYKDKLEAVARLEEIIDETSKQQKEIKNKVFGAYVESYDEFKTIEDNFDRLKKLHGKLSRKIHERKTPPKERVEFLLQRISLIEAMRAKHLQVLESIVSDAKRQTKQLNKKSSTLLDEQQLHIKQAMSALLALLQGRSTRKVAHDWAYKQYISKAAKELLKQINYSEESLREDLAEFYCLVNGKLDQINFDFLGCQRASSYLSKRVIYLDNQFSKHTLFHELGHMLEIEASYREAAQYFIKKKQLENSKFYDPYVNHVYDDGCTEVFSMGLQKFATPEHLYNLYTKDREMFYMMIGACS